MSTPPLNTPRQILGQLLERRSLSEAEAAFLLKTLTAPDLAPAMAGALLVALRAKGVTADEVRGFAGAMRALAIKPALPAALDAIDIVGTGGDGSGSLNLSTGAALLAAACGLPIVKHGNRSISSRSGSADLIEALGFALPLDEKRAAECFGATGFTFLFAPYFHSRRARHPHGFQLARAADQSRGAALLAGRRIRRADRGTDGRHAGGHAH